MMAFRTIGPRFGFQLPGKIPQNYSISLLIAIHMPYLVIIKKIKKVFSIYELYSATLISIFAEYFHTYNKMDKIFTHIRKLDLNFTHIYCGCCGIKFH